MKNFLVNYFCSQLFLKILCSDVLLEFRRHKNSMIFLRKINTLACGLVLSRTKLQGLAKKNKDSLIAGEDCEVNGQSVISRDRLEFEEDIHDFQIPYLEQLPIFLDEFNQALDKLEIDGLTSMEYFQPGEGLEPSYKEKLWRDTERKLTSVLLKIKGNSDNIRIELPFILGLKALLRVLGKEWAGK
ncbi:MAG: hypothetical protein AB4426_14030 [Xenococcaceae cyanobacterium]